MTVRELIAELLHADQDEQVRMLSDPEGNSEHPLCSVLVSAPGGPNGTRETILSPGYDPLGERQDRE